jgi:putative flippase GtrA
LGDVIRTLWFGAVGYLVKFGVVGLLGMVIDVGVFNLLRLGVFGTDHALQGPVGASIVSTSCAIVFNWAGNRCWTFRNQRRRNAIVEFLEYGAVSLLGMGVALACLWVSHYALGYDNLVADNISKNVVGLVLGTIVRFALFRYWVWGHHRTGKVVEPDLAEAASTIFEADPATPGR